MPNASRLCDRRFNAEALFPKGDRITGILLAPLGKGVQVKKDRPLPVLMRFSRLPR